MNLRHCNLKFHFSFTYFLLSAVNQAILAFFGNRRWIKQLFIVAARGSGIMSDNIFTSLVGIESIPIAFLTRDFYQNF